MIMYIWLDDIREIPEINIRHCVREEPEFGMNTYITYRAKSVNYAKSLIESAIKQNRYDGYLLDLDHDLGDYAKDGGDAYKLILWMIEKGYTTNKFKFRLHTMNPVGMENMKELIIRYFGKESYYGS